MAPRAITQMLTGGALVTVALAFAYTRRARDAATGRRLPRPHAPRTGALSRDLDPLGPDETLADILARTARFKPSPHGEAEALASADATWPFLQALDAVATEPDPGCSPSRTAQVIQADPGEAFFEAGVECDEYEEYEAPPTDSDPAVGDSGAFGTDLPVARFEENDDAIAPEDLGTEWLDRTPPPTPEHARK